MDLLSMLKLSNVFSPNGMTPQQFPVGSIGGPNVPTGDNQGLDHIQNSMMGNPQGMDLNTAIQGLLNPKDEQFQNFANMIQSMPQEKDYQPGTFRKIAGAIAGMGTGGPAAYDKGAALGYKSNIPEGLQVQKAITDEPYNKALTAWANKIKPQEAIATMEQSRNTGNRATALGALQRQQGQEKIDALAAQNDTKNEQNQQNIDIRRAREEAYVNAKKFTMDHPNYKSFTDKDGMLVFVNPQDPKAEPVKTDIDTGKLNDMQKIDLGIQGRLEEITAQGKNSKDLERAKQENRVANEDTRQLNRVDLKTTPAPARTVTPTVKPLLPTQQKVDTINKAQKLISDRPDLKGYIVLDKNNSGNITGVHIPPAGYFGNEQKRMEAYNLLFGEAPVPGVTQSNSSSVKAPTNTIRKEIPGHPGKFAVSSDGGKTWKAE